MLSGRERFGWRRGLMGARSQAAGESAIGKGKATAEGKHWAYQRTRTGPGWLGQSKGGRAVREGARSSKAGQRAPKALLRGALTLSEADSRGRT